jgi:hypothetical protein
MGRSSKLPPAVAVIVTVWVEATFDVLTGTVALVAVAGTMANAGTWAANALSL